MKTALLVTVLGALLALAAVCAVLAWRSVGDAEITADGLIALAFGVIVSLGLGIGLMALVFYSSRRGHDDRAGR